MSDSSETRPGSESGAAPLGPVALATRQALEFPALLRVVAELAATDLGRRRVLELSPHGSEADLRLHRQRLEDAQRLLGEGVLVESLERPMVPLLERLEPARRPLEGREILDLAALLEASRRAGERIHEAHPEGSALSGLAEGCPDTSALLQRIRRTLDRRGEVRDDASPVLAAGKERIRRLRQGLYRELQAALERHRDQLSEETVPLRGGRLVLVLRSGARGRVKGLFHGRSASGKSVYFEPLEVVDGNNELQQACEEEAAERQRIFSELLREVQGALPAFRVHAEVVAELDMLQASCRFAQRCGGRLPELGQEGEVVLIRARHPLLDPALAELRRDALGQPGHIGEVTPLDLELSPRLRALVITGPNAGGKTVALKTVGLCAVASQCGLPIPAEPGSRLGFWRHVVATVGDDQDVLADRSTFSGRLLRIKEAWSVAGPGTLVLLDELGSGTDPEEGGALATAVLEGLLERGSAVVVTTHLIQLASRALELEGASCGAMELDPVSGEPLYRLLPGPPGGSEALSLARRLGLDPELVRRAEGHLTGEARDLRRLLARVEQLRAELTAKEGRLRRDLSDVEELRRRLTSEVAALEEERRAVGSRLQRELEAYRRKVRDRLGDEVERLKGEIAAGRRRGLAAEAVAGLFRDAPQLAARAPGCGGPVRVGATVRHRQLGWQGELKRLERGRAEVRTGQKRLLCDPAELEVVEESSSVVEKAGGAARSRDQQRVATRQLQGEIKLIGLRVEEALEMVDRFLDEALLACLDEVRIVHGHGTGRLRDAVRRHLESHPAVTSQRPGRAREGGDGATVASLREE